MKNKHWLKTKQAKQLFSLFRWLHIYLSMALFSLLVFFCFTGITLNHTEWTSSHSVKMTTLALPKALHNTVQGSDELPLKKIQQFIEQHTQLSEPQSIDVQLDEHEITYDYLLPASNAFVSVFLTSGEIEIETQQGNFISLINDLHKGRNTGKYWQWLIDVSAVVILLFSFTGVFILFQNAKHRKNASTILIAGITTPVILYFLFVPRLMF